MIFTLLGDVYVGGEYVEEKTAVRLTPGTAVHLKSSELPSQILLFTLSTPQRTSCMGRPIVMNTQKELEQSFMDLQTGQFIKEKAQY